MHIRQTQFFVIQNAVGQLLCSGIKRTPFVHYWSDDVPGKVLPEDTMMWSKLAWANEDIAKAKLKLPLRTKLGVGAKYPELDDIVVREIVSHPFNYFEFIAQ